MKVRISLSLLYKIAEDMREQTHPNIFEFLGQTMFNFLSY